MENKILELYTNYKEKSLQTLTIKHKDIEQVITNLTKDFFEVLEIGKSFEDRKIYQIKTGKGKIKVLLWSQMHGNEAVGTMAIFDVLNFFIATDELNYLRKLLLEKCTFYLIPMLNPDGAEVGERRNAQQIDLNRDALKLTALESQLLYKITDELKPDFGFNLHDQEIYYGSENSNKPTTLAFLTPSFDEQKTIDNSRTKSMLLIADLFKMLQNYIPQQVAKYNDSYMSNAFGDNIQKKKISTILIEAGYIHDDIHRQKVRKYYFLSLIYAFKSISEKNYEKFELQNYFDIPMNIKMKFCDYLLKNITIEKNNKKYTTDVAIIRNVLNTEQFTDFVENYIIWDIGDLKNKNAFDTVDCNGFVIKNEKKMFKRLKKANFLLNSIKM